MFNLYRISFILFLLIKVLVPAPELSAQEKKEEKPKWIDFHGFINYEIMYDTRQNQVSRDGEVIFYPKPFEADRNGVDKNAHGKLHMFSFHTRLRAEIKEFEFFKMKASGLIEGDFIGASDAAANLIRLRHAYMKFVSPKFEWLAGQYWHPMFVSDCSPEVISWGAAAPIHVLGRVPQLRLTYFLAPEISIMGSINSQRDLGNMGSNGTSTEYLKNSQIPEVQFQFMLKPSIKFIAGFTAGHKVIVPRMVTDSGYVCNESLGSYNFNLFTRYKGDRFDFKLQAIYAQNQNNLLLFGGYAVSQITDIITNTKEYTNLNTASVWTEMSYKFKDFKLGIFAGITKNLGADTYIDNITQIYGTGTNINYLYNISPRLVYAPDRIKFAFELNHLAASFGSFDSYLRIVNDNRQANYRYLFSVSLNF